MEKRDSIITNYKSIDYEGLKMEQSLIDFIEVNARELERNCLVEFKDIYYGLISLN